MAIKATATTKKAGRKAPAKKAVAKKAATKPAEKAKAQKKLSQIDAAIRVLEQADGPMTCSALIEEMAKKKLWTSPNGKTPAATLCSAILRAILNGMRMASAICGRVHP